MTLNNFKWVEDISEFDGIFIKSYNEESDEGYFLEVNVQYPQNVHNFYNDLPFLSKRMKIEQDEQLLANLHYKEEYVKHIRNLKQALNYGLVLKKVLRMIKFNKKDWLKPYIDMNTDLRGKKTDKLILKKIFKWMNNAFFGKTIENIRRLGTLNL